MKKDEISNQLKAIIAQYGFPTPELTPRFKSLLQDLFVDHPRELNILIAGLEEGIPRELSKKKGIVPFEILSEQMIVRLDNTRGMSRDAAEWGVQTWAVAAGYEVPVKKSDFPVKNIDEQGHRPIISEQKKAETNYTPSNQNTNYPGIQQPPYYLQNLNQFWEIYSSGIVILGFILQKIGLYNDAIRMYDHALRINPEYAEALNDKGEALYEQGNYKEAIRLYDQSLKIDPEYALAWNNKGNALDELGRYEEALKAYDQAIHIDQYFSLAWNNKGWVLYNQGKYFEAIEAYNKALEIAPHYSIAQKNRDLAFRKLNK